jgi:hypothetical protein
MVDSGASKVQYSFTFSYSERPSGSQRVAVSLLLRSRMLEYPSKFVIDAFMCDARHHISSL